MTVDVDSAPKNLGTSNGPLTILCLSGDNDVALDHQILQRRPFC